MRFTIFLIFVLSPIFCAAQNFEINAGYCKIKFPAEPVESVDTIIEGIDTIFLETWEKDYDFESTENTNLGYMMMNMNFPSSYIYSDSSYQFISNLLDTSVSSITGTGDAIELLSTSLDMIEGYPGKVFKMKVKESNSHLILKSYIVRNQLIVLFIISKSDNWFSTDNDLFFDSFELVDAPKNKIDYGFTVIKKETYAVDFLGKFITESSFVETEHGTVNLITKMMEKKDSEDNLFFISAETKYPKLIDYDAEEFYERSIAGSLNSTNAILIEKNKIKYKEYDGYEFHSSMYDGKMIGFYRVFLIENRLYLFGVLSMVKEKNKEVHDFFDSFKLLKK